MEIERQCNGLGGKRGAPPGKEEGLMGACRVNEQSPDVDRGVRNEIEGRELKHTSEDRHVGALIKQSSHPFRAAQKGWVGNRVRNEVKGNLIEFEEGIEECS